MVGLSRKTRKRLGQLAFSLLPIPGKTASRFGILGSFHPIFGFFWVGPFVDSVRNSGSAYRSDVFRILIGNQFPGQDLLYADLDIYFAPVPERWDFSESFTYRWGPSWANSAVLFLSSNRTDLLVTWRAALRKGTPALPWFFFSDENCLTYGIRVLDCDLFDPAWSKDSVSMGKASLFFQNSADARDFVTEIRRRALTVHWHGQWTATPETYSPYDIFLRETVDYLAHRGEIVPPW